MNGAPLPPEHGFPPRVIAPGCSASPTSLGCRGSRRGPRVSKTVSWGATTSRFAKKTHDGRTEWVETSVGRAQIKSAPARVVRDDGRYKIVGMAWGAPIARVEVSIDGGPWQIATIDPTRHEKYAWRLWSLDWPAAAPGEHAITVRATGADDSVQPAPTDPQ